MKLSHFGLSFACAGALALTQVAGAQTYGGQSQTGQGAYGQQGSQGMQHAQPLSSRDQQFLKEAAESNLASIKSAQIAQQKATDPNVKRFAEEQLRTHQNMQTQLNQIAQQHNMTLPTQMSSADQREYNKLANLSGSQFDREYSKWVADTQQKMLKDYRKESQSGQNTQLKTFASSHVTTIQNDMQTAQNLERGGAAAAGQADGMGQQDQTQQDQNQGQSQPDQNNPY